MCRPFYLCFECSNLSIACSNFVEDLRQTGEFLLYAILESFSSLIGGRGRYFGHSSAPFKWFSATGFQLALWKQEGDGRDKSG
jgi:hypothetical protein